ncbi:hypothetical protein CASFOL_031153 [Castilleja foliolosa]|uniref:Uncharacterized protein n=1 Tax=Castilleja foliolosa TaxID=1961234 RepID=A0ABD3C3X9_9LAMI
MAEGHLPEIIVFGPPTIFYTHGNKLSSRFRVLKPFESPIPLAQFLTAQAQTTRAALCSSSFTLSAAVLRHLPSLRMVFACSAGLDNIDLAECRRRGIAVANAAEIFSTDVADLAVGLLLDVLRKISAGDGYLKDGLWIKQGSYPLGYKLGGKQVGIVGLGSIGLKVAKRLESFGCDISYHSRTKKPSIPYVFYPDIQKLASTSDILILCCSLTDQTHHMINRDILLALGKEGFIVNVARGAVIDEKELVSCLRKGEIGGAGLDVFENEPCVLNELYRLDNVVLSPHAGVFTEESFRDLFELVIGNLEAFFLEISR